MKISLFIDAELRLTRSIFYEFVIKILQYFSLHSKLPKFYRIKRETNFFPFITSIIPRFQLQPARGNAIRRDLI